MLPGAKSIVLGGQSVRRLLLPTTRALIVLTADVPLEAGSSLLRQRDRRRGPGLAPRLPSRLPKTGPSYAMKGNLERRLDDEIGLAHNASYVHWIVGGSGLGREPVSGVIRAQDLH